MGNDFNSLSCSAWSALGANYPITDDRATSFWSEFGSGAVPRNVIVDIEGTVRYNSAGFNQSAITNVITQLLAVTGTEPEDLTPHTSALISSYPNPFNAGTQIKVTLRAPGQASLSIFDARGEHVQTLMSGALDAGNHTFQWDGVDRHGNNLPGGVYMARLQTNNQVITRKLVMLK